MRWFPLALLMCARLALAGLEDYPQLVWADKKPTRGGVRVTYLGVAGYQFEAEGHSLLVDPYFTRVGLGAVLFNEKVEPNEARIAAGMKHVRPRPDAVLVTHAHIDHLLDVPPIVKQTGALLVAGPTAVNQAISLDVLPWQCAKARPGQVLHVGPWTIRVIAAAHDRILGSVRPPGKRSAPGAPPKRANDWGVGEPLAFLIEAAGQRIYIESGGVPGCLPPKTKVDLAILGVALPDARRHFAPAVRRLNPDYLLPSHQDNFFQPFDRGFTFGPLTDFPDVYRTWQREKLPGRMFLLDYFRPWTLR